MSKDSHFWRNATLIGLAHVAVISGLVYWNRQTKSAKTQSIVWMNGGAGDGAVSATPAGSTPRPTNAMMSTPEGTPLQTNDVEDERPVLTSAKSDIQLPTSTRRPRPTSTPKS